MLAWYQMGIFFAHPRTVFDATYQKLLTTKALLIILGGAN
jgi:hypothetical protein